MTSGRSFSNSRRASYLRSLAFKEGKKCLGGVFPRTNLWLAFHFRHCYCNDYSVYALAVPENGSFLLVVARISPPEPPFPTLA
jgi:hypothetical protein